MIRILVVDHQLMFREALRRLIDAEPDFVVVGQCGISDNVMELIKEVAPDIVVWGLSEDAGALALLRQCYQQDSGLQFVVLADRVERTDLVRALVWGAKGIVQRESGSESLFRCIRAVKSGQIWVSRSLVSDLVQLLRSRTDGTGITNNRPYGLTPRELDIVGAVVEGLVNKDIADTFNVTEYTVKHHLTRIFDKLGVGNRVELAIFAVQHNLVQRSLKSGSRQEGLTTTDC